MRWFDGGPAGVEVHFKNATQFILAFSNAYGKVHNDGLTICRVRRNVDAGSKHHELVRLEGKRVLL